VVHWVCQGAAEALTVDRIGEQMLVLLAVRGRCHNNADRNWTAAMAKHHSPLAPYFHKQK
jgi:hypothetical protein